jgi:hypothetical protein
MIDVEAGGHHPRGTEAGGKKKARSDKHPDAVALWFQ